MSDSIFSQLLDNELEVFIKNTDLFPADKSGHLKGIHVEATFRNIVRKFVPQGLEVSNGWIFDENGNKSEERDILIYNPRKAPRFLFEAGVGIIPLASVCYDIQIKSKLTPKIIESTYKKFNNKVARNVLIAIKGTNLLENYLKIDQNALVSPKICVMSSEEDKYYFFHVRKVKYSDIFTKERFLQEIANNGIKINSDKITLNGLDLNRLDEYSFTIFQWQSFKFKYNVKSFFIGLVNTLFKNSTGNYITNSTEDSIGQVLTRTLTDHNGNILKQEINLTDGLPEEYFSFSCQIDNGNPIVTLKEDINEK